VATVVERAWRGRTPGLYVVLDHPAIEGFCMAGSGGGADGRGIGRQARSASGEISRGLKRAIGCRSCDLWVALWQTPSTWATVSIRSRRVSVEAVCSDPSVGVLPRTRTPSCRTTRKGGGFGTARGDSRLGRYYRDFGAPCHREQHLDDPSRVVEGLHEQNWTGCCNSSSQYNSGPASAPRSLWFFRGNRPVDSSHSGTGQRSTVLSRRVGEDEGGISRVAAWLSLPGVVWCDVEAKAARAARVLRAWVLEVALRGVAQNGGG